MRTKRIAAVFGLTLSLLLPSAVYGQMPDIVIAPESQAVPEGGTAYLTVSVSGALPMTYRWRRNFDFTPYYEVTLDSTNCTLVLTNLTPDKACFFNLDVSNAYGYGPGKQAVVAVISSGIETNGFVLTVYGLTNSIWRVDCNTNLQAANWFTLTNFSIPARPPVFRFVDLEATNMNRFYRVIPKVF